MKEVSFMKERVMKEVKEVKFFQYEKSKNF